jgi:DNA-binding NtrC family response regulator
MEPFTHTRALGDDGMRLLVVEDDRAFAYALSERLRREQFEVEVAAGCEEAVTCARAQAPLLAVIDSQLPDGTGVDLVRRLSAGEDFEPIPSIMLTGFGSIDGAVEAMRAGCMDYVTKGTDFDEIVLRVRKSLELAALRLQVARYEEAFARTASDSGLDGTSPAIEALRDQVRAAASSPDTTVLIIGESGTGKQLVARAIHAASARRKLPLVEVDCTTLSLALFESELFGHERGAFTGADQRKQGLVEMAAGGTLLLDEIGELGPAVQGKLLRLLQERRFRRVGSLRDHDIDVRILAATNRDLEAEVAAGRFRADLYYRLHVLHVHTPPLRERGDDVILLAERFLFEFSRRLGKGTLTLTEDACRFLSQHPFPGNVRQLRAMVEQAVLRSRGELIDAALLTGGGNGAKPRRPRRGRPRQTLSLEDAQRIREAMIRHFGNQSKAAEALGISRFALRRKLRLLVDTEAPT